MTIGLVVGETRLLRRGIERGSRNMTLTLLIVDISSKVICQSILVLWRSGRWSPVASVVDAVCRLDDSLTGSMSSPSRSQ